MYDRKKAEYLEAKCREMELIIDEYQIERRRRRLRAIEERWQEFTESHHLMGPGPPPKKRRIIAGSRLPAEYYQSRQGGGQPFEP